MKRPSDEKSGAVRAADTLLSVCKTGLNNPDREMRRAFAVLAELIEDKRDDWAVGSPVALLTDKPEAALAGQG